MLLASEISCSRSNVLVPVSAWSSPAESVSRSRCNSVISEIVALYSPLSSSRRAASATRIRSVSAAVRDVLGATRVAFDSPPAGACLVEVVLVSAGLPIVAPLAASSAAIGGAWSVVSSTAGTAVDGACGTRDAGADLAASIPTAPSSDTVSADSFSVPGAVSRGSGGAVGVGAAVVGAAVAVGAASAGAAGVFVLVPAVFGAAAFVAVALRVAVFGGAVFVAAVLVAADALAAAVLVAADALAAAVLPAAVVRLVVAALVAGAAVTVLRAGAAFTVFAAGAAFTVFAAGAAFTVFAAGAAFTGFAARAAFTGFAAGAALAVPAVFLVPVVFPVPVDFVAGAVFVVGAAFLVAAFAGGVAFAAPDFFAPVFFAVAVDLAGAAFAALVAGGEAAVFFTVTFFAGACFAAAFVAEPALLAAAFVADALVAGAALPAAVVRLVVAAFVAGTVDLDVAFFPDAGLTAAADRPVPAAVDPVAPFLAGDFAATAFPPPAVAAADLVAVRPPAATVFVAPREAPGVPADVAAAFDAPFRAARTRSAMASPTCKMGARRGAAHSRGWQEYGTYGPATNMPHELAQIPGRQTRVRTAATARACANGPADHTG